VLEEMIDAGGHPVVTATNGAEGLAALAQVAPPALVLLDLMMPVMSGFAFLEELARRKDRAGDKVLLISANETGERAAQRPGGRGTSRSLPTGTKCWRWSRSISSDQARRGPERGAERFRGRRSRSRVRGQTVEDGANEPVGYGLTARGLRGQRLGRAADPTG